MDVFLAAETFCGGHHKKDQYAPYPGTLTAGGGQRDMLPAVALGLLAAYVSWGANKGYPPGLRMVSAVLAFLFGGLYLMYYALFAMWKPGK